MDDPVARMVQFVRKQKLQAAFEHARSEWARDPFEPARNHLNLAHADSRRPADQRIRGPFAFPGRR